jgi:hypothetical protein
VGRTPNERSIKSKSLLPDRRLRRILEDLDEERNLHVSCTWRFVNLKACFYQALAEAFERDQIEGLTDEETIGQVSRLSMSWIRRPYEN